MLKLYSMPGTCALAVHIALEWAKIPYELRLMLHGENHSLDYLQINALGSVPALQLRDHSVITEASALLMFIDDEAAEVFGAPTRNHYGRARLAEMLSFYTTEVHAAFAPHFAPARFHPEHREHLALKAQAYERLRLLFDLIDDTLTGTYVFGPERSVADPYLYVLSRWIAGTPLKLDDFPLLKAFKVRMDQDLAVQKVLSCYT